MTPPTPVSTAVGLGAHTMAVDRWGEPHAPPVVLLHGIPGWRGTWRDVAARLVPRAFVVAPDLVGFGESSPAPPRFHASDQADLVIALCRQLGLDHVHLVGFDFGGPTAVLVATRAPRLVASLTLAAANVLADTPIPLPLQLVRPPVLGEVFARLVFGRAGLSMLWWAAVRRRDRFPLARYREMLRFAQGVASTRRLFQASLRDLPGLYGPVQAALAALHLPSVVVWGDRDPFFPIAVGERTAAQITGARFVVASGCGHFLPAEDPDVLAEVVLDLIAAGSETRRHATIAAR